MFYRNVGAHSTVSVVLILRQLGNFWCMSTREKATKTQESSSKQGFSLNSAIIRCVSSQFERSPDNLPVIEDSQLSVRFQLWDFFEFCKIRCPLLDLITELIDKAVINRQFAESIEHQLITIQGRPR